MTTRGDRKSFRNEDLVLEVTPNSPARRAGIREGDILVALDGAGLATLSELQRALTAEAMSGRFHGNDERIDVDSLALTTSCTSSARAAMARSAPRTLGTSAE